MNAIIRSSALAAALVAASGVFLTCAGASSAPLAQAPAADPVAAGIAQFKAGNFAGAEATLRTAKGTEASAYLAGSLVKQKKYAEAEAPARAAVTAAPTHPVAVASLGNALVGLKKYDDAITAMTAAITAKGDQAYAFFWRGQAYDGKKQPANMAADYQKFLTLAPTAPEATTLRAILSTLH